MAPIIASISGGKDSTALCLWLQEQGLEYRAVHLDTGWEHPKTDEYLREVLPRYVGPIEWVAGPRTMAEAIRWKGCFPARTGRWCTQQLKVFPMMAWIEEQYGQDKVFNAVGIRAAESKARSKLDEYQDAEWAIAWRPLLTWSEQDVIDIHRRHGVPPNPLYLMGASRVGCWPCIFASKAEIRMVADTDPGRIDEIERLEEEVYQLSKARYDARGETFESLGYRKPSFFALKKWVAAGEVGPDGKVVPGAPAEGRVRKNCCAPIREVVEWARTKHGGKQVELFFEDDRSGCMRWGLCDS